MSTIKTENNGVTTTITATGEINTRDNMVTGTGIGIGTGMGSGTSNVGASFGSGAFQLPNIVTATAPTTTSTMTRNNISVTNIKCELVEDAASTTMVIGTSNGNIVPVITSGVAAGYYNGSSNGGGGGGSSIRIPLTKAEDSDSEAELTNIENLKVTRRVVSTSATSASGHMSADHKNGPRPMSWEGELSETETTETELMETENSLSNSGVLASTTITVIKSEATTTTTTLGLPIQSGVGPPSGTHTLIKPELEQSSSGGVVGGNSIDLQYSPHTKLKLGPTQSDPINLKYEPPVGGEVNSPLLARQKSSNLPLPANPSPDSAIHSVYTHSSPSQSPLTSRHAPYTPSLSRNNSDASHSSCYSYSSEFSPTHSPIQGRHAATPGSAQLYGAQYNGGSLHHSMLYRPISLDAAAAASEAQNLSMDAAQNAATTATALNLGGGSAVDGSLASSAAGISRQQLINSPCPICGDKISGFHYGIFSCESCKGFFKRTVQNRKNYVCVRGGPCSVSISTRKKCPACRFEKCLQKGMKLEAIREDRTRGGRSTYQCSYTLPNSMLSPLLSPDQQGSGASSSAGSTPTPQQRLALGNAPVSLTHGVNGFAPGALTPGIKKEQTDGGVTVGTTMINSALRVGVNNIPVLMQEIMDVEHLWRFSESELARLNQPFTPSSESSSGHEGSARSGAAQTTNATQMTNPLLASAGFSSCNGENADPYLIAHLCSVADHRLYKIVKWCKSLPLFKNISIDDQICLLINSWCELLLFSCCFRSVDTPGQIKLSQGKKLNLSESKLNGTQPCIERMLNLTDQLRRLRVDSYEYVTLKVIVLLQSDTSELKEPVKVRECQEQALQCLQNYTLAHYPDTPSKFGELLLRIPELQRTCQLGKEMLTVKSHDGSDFNLLMELLRGEH